MGREKKWVSLPLFSLLIVPSLFSSRQPLYDTKRSLRRRKVCIMKDLSELRSRGGAPTNAYFLLSSTPSPCANGQ